MDRLAGPQFAASLNALAETLDRKPISAKAMELWFDTLKEFDANRVLAFLGSWAKSHPKFPTPAELWKALSEDRSAQLEKTATAEKAFFSKVYSGVMATEHGRNRLAECQAILARPKPNALQHWTAVLQDSATPDIARRFADNFFKRRGEAATRVPGQDDEEVAA